MTREHVSSVDDKIQTWLPLLITKVSKNIFNKNYNNVGLLRTVKKYGYKKNTANNKIEMGATPTI